MTQFLGLALTDAQGRDAFAASGGGAGLVRGARFVYDAGGTKTIATEWAPPTGYELDGWEVIAIGAGAGTKPANPSNYRSGAAGKRVCRYVRRTDLDAAATTVVITVGAGVAGESGGASSFGGLVYAAGGLVGDGNLRQPIHPDLFGAMVLSTTGNQQGVQEGDVGNGSPSGRSGGAGGMPRTSPSGTALVSVGLAAWPHPNSFTTQGVTSPGSATTFNVYPFTNLGNPTTTAGATGHDGVGDGAGGGGNSCTYTYNSGYYDPETGSSYPDYYSYSGSPGQGGFPGGGAGFSGVGATNTTQRGGHGRVIVYPYFRPTT